MPATMQVPVRVRVPVRVIGALLFGTIVIVSALILVANQTKVITATSFAAARGMQTMNGAVASAGSQSAPLEMEVGNNGMTYLQDARVEAVSGNDITVSIAWGSASFLWTVQTTGTTKFLDVNGNDESAQNIVPGEYVNVTGQIDQLSQSPTVNAQYVHQS